MLPGFRFLFVATVLTVSLLVFGLGAAALLRASHERFASLPMRPAPAPVFIPTVDATPLTLAILRVEPAPAEVSAPEPVAAPVDTLLPTDKLAALSKAPRVEEMVAQPLSMSVEAKPEKNETKTEPGPAPEPAATVTDTLAMSVSPTAEPVAGAKVEETAPIELPVAAAPEPQQVAALPEPEVTASTSAPIIAEQPLLNAKPIRRPPIPADRPAAADVAALPDPTLAIPVPETIKPIVRKRKSVVKRVVVKKPRLVARAKPRRPTVIAPNPASPFGAPGFGASPFGT